MSEKHSSLLLPLLACTLLAGCGNDSTAPLTIDYEQPGAPLLSQSALSQQAAGVAQIRDLGSHCSGFVIDHGVNQAPAYLLTNGHCVGLFDSAAVLHSQHAQGRARFNLFIDDFSRELTVNLTEISWASMRGTDIALVKTDQTLGELRAKGVTAYKLAALPKAGTQISIIGVPVHNIPQQEWALRQTQCKAGNRTRLFEFVWIWDQAQAGDCVGILPGNSGSPVFDKQGQVVGIVNTSTIGSQIGGNCYLGKPCELTTNGVVSRSNTSYWLAVDGVRGCFSKGEFNLSAAGCRLEQPEPFLVHNAARVSQSPASWQAELNGPRTISLKSGPLHSTDCRNAEGYQGSYYAGERFEKPIDVQSRSQDSHWLLCAAGYGADGKIDTSTAGFTTLTIDNTPPVRSMELYMVRFDDGLSFQPLFSPPELSSYRWKVGEPAKTDCAEPAGYRIFFRIPRFADNDELPLKVCLIGSDEAGNESQPKAILLDK